HAPFFVRIGDVYLFGQLEGAKSNAGDGRLAGVDGDHITCRRRAVCMGKPAHGVWTRSKRSFSGKPFIVRSVVARGASFELGADFSDQPRRAPIMAGAGREGNAWVVEFRSAGRISAEPQGERAT